ncbi:unnamed protein product [Nesidiocoris tenuis]|uniref:Uncharacterized protein n=1 Tax=Nesidiocoris tenuis TaxID=355587 RepID=A0A6H5HS86_9HEMI|nr:unnamed protein product [Nesidiocoris tenuis]
MERLRPVDAGSETDGVHLYAELERLGKQWYNAVKSDLSEFPFFNSTKAAGMAIYGVGIPAIATGHRHSCIRRLYPRANRENDRFFYLQTSITALQNPYQHKVNPESPISTEMRIQSATLFTRSCNQSRLIEQLPSALPVFCVDQSVQFPVLIAKRRESEIVYDSGEAKLMSIVNRYNIDGILFRCRSNHHV